MSNFKVLIVEDEPLYASNLEMLTIELGYECMGIVDHAEAALQQIKTDIPDLILMDVNLTGSMDGITLAQTIHQQHDIPTIFITSLRDNKTYNRAKAIRPYAFISKPFDETDLQRTIELAVRRLKEIETEETEPNWSQDMVFKNCFFVKVRQSLVKIAFSEILYLEVEKHYCTLYTQKKKFVVRMSLSDILKKLPQESFLQTHRNYVVNADKINSFDLGDSVVFVANHSIPLSRNYKNRLLEWLEYL